jgi:putative colanic acid biosynthesis UDP-glucose lipid carrier transferase
MAVVVEIKRFVRNSKQVSPKSKGVKSRPNRTIYLIGKRLFDIVVSILVITLVLSWLIPILAVLIRLDSKGPVFFVQNRVGFLGCTFRCYKLRTMVVNDEADSKQALNNDSRITRLGGFLRVTSLDELPQFLNVLMGSMSIVGPRPFMLKDDQSFSIVVSNYPLRYCARPGITGMAQVKGYRGPTANFHSIFHRYQWDAFYIRNASPSLDFKIIRITVRQTIKSLFPLKINAQRNEYAPINTRQMVMENINIS